MKKELPKHVKDALANANPPEGQIAIAFLHPKDGDKFIEHNLGDDYYRVELDGSFSLIQVIRGKKNPEFSVIDSKYEDEFHQAKLYGYIMFKIIQHGSK